MADEDVTIHTRRGTELRAVLRRPDDADTGRLPAVVLCQGLSGVCDVVLPDIAAALATAGIVSVRFDYAGYGGSHGERGWIDPPARVVDAQHVLAWLAAAPGVDATRLGVYGHSYGGPIAISTAARDRRVRAVVAVSGPASGRAMLAAARPAWDWLTFLGRVDAERAAVAAGAEPTIVPTSDLLPLSPAFAAAYAELLGRTGEQGTSTAVRGAGLGTTEHYLLSADAMLAYDPVDDARKVTGAAVLLVQGELDDIALVDDTAALFAALPGIKVWQRVPGIGHLELDHGDGLAGAARLAADWFTTHLVTPFAG